MVIQQVSAMTQQTVDCTLNNDGCHYDPTDCSNDSNAATLDVTPGDGAPDGMTFPNLDPGAMANAINKWIAKVNPDSKLGGLGKVIVASGKNKDVNPFLVVSIAREESGLSDPTDYNVKNGNNSFGRTASDRQPHFQGARTWYKWSSVKASVDYTASENRGAIGGGDMPSYMVQVYGDAIKNNNLEAIMQVYAPPSENKTAQYVADVKGWMKEMAELSKGGGSSADTSTTENTDSSSAPDGAAASCDPRCESPSPQQTSGAATIAIDPGHGPNKTVVDQKTGLKQIESPGGSGDEIGHVWNTANILKKSLESDGYKVVMTKSSENDDVTFRGRANIADNAKADLALSIHGDSSLPNPGEVYPQKVGLYRGTGSKKTVFSDKSVADKSQQYSKVFQEEREKTSGKNVVLKDNTLGFATDRGVGMETGNIAMVQLFSKTPWVYNEKKIPFKDKDYADELENSIKKALPISKTQSQQDTQNNTNVNDLSECSIGNASGSVQDLVNTAMQLAWSDGPHGTSQKPSYKKALSIARQKGWYFGGAAGNDCGGFVTVVMRLSGADPNYNSKKEATPGQKAYLDSKPGTYKNLGQPKSTKDLQPGDIAINSGHTFIYVGPVSGHPNFKGDQASASYSANFANSRAPSAETLGVYPGHSDGAFTFYRLIKGNNN